MSFRAAFSCTTLLSGSYKAFRSAYTGEEVGVGFGSGWRVVGGGVF